MAPISSTTVSIVLVHQLFRRLDIATERKDALIQKVGIPPALLAENAARVTTEQFSDLYRLLARETDDELLGMFSRPARGGTLKYLCLSMLQSKNLRTALYSFGRFFRLILDDFTFVVSRQDNLVYIALEPTSPDHPISPFAQGMMLKLVHGVISWLAARKIPLARVDFTYHRPASVSEYVYLYPGPAYFEQPRAALYFESDQLEAPIRQDKGSLRAFLDRAPADWLFVSFAERIISHRVREYLATRLLQPCSIDDVAHGLHISVRTLSRRLREEDTTFQAVKDELRRDIAVQMLIKTDLPISVIGTEVGFHDSTTFHRAFKTWTGGTPKSYRGHHE
ncbi:AraC family transcriptional regulator [Crenobacter sp. SG2303]|uniref:AraC family transcriptional regulator n=1 Tax=Crenobacter oryzisoli TaxID=3056844 RepID=A0ABT7XP01_9NEIS|nr:AraC family transcriptional regulator [Crenobacter sp. SG2303]MDN0075294.1 AraC family transcriptional regulator [Crenobacter sp. SG2303]